MPHTRPAAAQSVAQQRLVPVASTAQTLEAHCAGRSQPVPVVRRSLHAPAAAEQPLPHSCTARAPLVQVRRVAPSHWLPVPLH